VNSLPPVAELVPHGPPMLALEQLSTCEPGRATGTMQVRESLFLREGRLDAVVTLEYMAQLVAACLGHEGRRAGVGVRVGMVVACRSMTLARAELLLGERLVLNARCIRRTESVSQFETETHDGSGALVSRATMTLVHGEPPAP